jgi:Protein of unknown function (DUF4240)
MDREQFWALIEAARTATGGDCQAQTAQLVAALCQRPVAEVLDWDRIQDELWVESYHRDLWGAAYLINGGCSDDGFDYFRGWLLGQGPVIWQAALLTHGSDLPARAANQLPEVGPDQPNRLGLPHDNR